MRQLATAEIIAVGSELLTPHRTDTNSLYLTAQLNELGIDVRTKCVVGDNLADLVGMFKLALTRADVVLLTGGLGPTADDVTRDGIAAALNLHLHESAEIVGAIQARFASRGLQMPDINRRQAHVPEGARVLPNANGTAPGLWIDAGEQVVVLLPGPPRELQPIFETHVRPGLASRTGSRQLRRRILKITGRPESGVEQIAQPLYGPMADWPVPVETTILAAPGQIELHLSARGDDAAKIDRVLDEAVTRLASALGDIVFSADGRSLPEVVGQLLLEQGARVAVAESCTGGLVLGRLTDVPGSSSWVIGGVTAYSNDVKIHQLGVAAAMIAEFGAVSEPVARAMADGVRERLAADVSVSVTGIAGPAGGTVEKPVGTVVIATSGPRSLLRTFRFPGDRAMVRTQATQAALDMLRRTLIGA